MFEVVGAMIVAVNLFGVVVDDQLYSTIQTLANLATVFLLVWHQRHVRREIEPDVKETAATIRRRIGGRRENIGEHEEYDGPERRESTE